MILNELFRQVDWSSMWWQIILPMESSSTRGAGLLLSFEEALLVDIKLLLLTLRGESVSRLSSGPSSSVTLFSMTWMLPLCFKRQWRCSQIKKREWAKRSLELVRVVSRKTSFFDSAAQNKKRKIKKRKWKDPILKMRFGVRDGHQRNKFRSSC